MPACAFAMSVCVLSRVESPPSVFLEPTLKRGSAVSLFPAFVLQS